MSALREKTPVDAERLRLLFGHTKLAGNSFLICFCLLLYLQ